LLPPARQQRLRASSHQIIHRKALTLSRSGSFAETLGIEAR